MKKVLDGNVMCGNIAQFFSELCFAYPITPSSPMASTVENLIDKNRKNLFNRNTKIIEMQSEAGVAGAMHGALIDGTLTSTFTSSQGLLLMLPNLYKMVGEGLPGVIHVASRTIATNALSIYGDHSDVYAAINTGVNMLSSSNIEDIKYLSIVAHLSSIEGSLPFIHFFDGFRTSHELNTSSLISDETLLSLVDFDAIKKFKDKSLTMNKFERGMSVSEDIYFQTVEALNNDFINMSYIVKKNMDKINQVFNTNYQPFEYYGVLDAENVIVCMGSVSDTVKLVIDHENKQGKKYGLITVRLFKPFNKDFLIEALPKSVKNIAVLDRSKEFGSVGEPLYLNVLASLNGLNIKVIGGRYGLSSKNTTPSDILGVFNNLETEQKNNFTISINDDVSNLSLKSVPIDIDLNAYEIKVYGFGSDGMVSASKNLIKLIGEKTNKYTQGYFEYDSKKSGGLTISHLRVSDKLIHAPYYVTNVNIAIITKDSYLKKYHLFDEIKNNGLVVINTKEELSDIIINEYNYQKIQEKNLKFIVIDANKIASDNNIPGKISMIMEKVIIDILDISFLKEELINSIKTKFITKGEEVVNNNINAISSVDNLTIIDNIEFKNIVEEKNDLFSRINNHLGNDLKVSELSIYKNGVYEGNTSKLDNKDTTGLIPNWDSSKCSQCNMCVSICPHAVIRPVVNEAEGIPLREDPKQLYRITINEEQCTSCGLCSKICPTKAISMGSKTGSEQEFVAKYFDQEVSRPVNNLKDLGFVKPDFEYSSACSGCGEANYIKMLSQLLKNRLVIANATGCSSIYGGSAPVTPYNMPWANSLFEDNAEFSLGIKKSLDIKKEYVLDLINETMESVSETVKSLYQNYLANQNDYEKVSKIIEDLKTQDIPKELKDNLDLLLPKVVWAVGGDGWAYDIGFGGIDHVLSSGENINILVLDTEIYSNTGGQASKSTHAGAVAEFQNTGKKTTKKDLFKIAMTYPNVYVASTSYLANPMHTFKVLNEAINHNGPSIVIAYATCIEQGISCGLKNSIEEQKLLVDSGYVLLMRYDNKLTIDSKAPNFDKLDEVYNNESRYKALKIKNKEHYEELLNLDKEYLKNRYDYFNKQKGE